MPGRAAMIRCSLAFLWLIVTLHMLYGAEIHEEGLSPEATDLANYLFPNMLKSRRKLYGNFIENAEVNCPNVKNDTVVPCVKCNGLTQCQALNGYVVQEVYYPKNLDLSGTCLVLEDLGERMNEEIFGEGRTFRDTEDCREMVMQYLCLFWGSNNPMYTNCCRFQEDVTAVDPANQIVAPRAPCKGFCIQIAEVCALDMNFVQLCENIECPQDEGECTADPSIDGINLAANVGCNPRVNADPYGPNSASSTKQMFVSSLHTGIALVVCMMMYMSIFTWS